MTFVDELCARIASNPRFVEDYQAILRQTIIDSAKLGSSVPLGEEAVRRLLQSATLFAQSSIPEWRQLAYRISFGSLAYNKPLEGVDEAARLTLARLGNYPAIKFAFRGDAAPHTLTPSIFYEIEGRQLDNTVRIGGRNAVLTDMQKSVWDAISSGSSLALSAPTSAGKSFVFLAYIERLKRAQPQANIVYIVPSRALISQVADDLRESGADQSFGVATVPILSPVAPGGTPIYVLTPERLQVLFQGEESLTFDVAIVDEAHLIGEGSRGVVLHSVLQDLQRRKPDVQFLFSSPQVRDPAVFGSVVGNTDVHVVKTNDSPVAQNIILLRGNSTDTLLIRVALWSGGNSIPLAELSSVIPVYNSADRLIYCSWSLGAGSQNLVYAGGPAQCEDIALKIKQLNDDQNLPQPITQIPPSDETIAARIELSKFAKEAVHSTYGLAETVLSGVGFHYGRIPALLRAAVEDAFGRGHLDYIVCTSTLLQGVNLPARNIFMQNPHKGDDHPIDPVDFWNLAGRAGRLGKDFQGNVFLIDYEDWESAPLAGPKDEVVRPSLEVTLTDSEPDLLDYIRSRDHASGASPLLEASFSKLYRDHRHGHLDMTLNRMAALSPDAIFKLKETINEADAAISISSATLDASPQMSGYRQQQLYDYMVAKIRDKGPDYLIPVHPSADWKQAIDKLRPIFARVHKYLELKSGNHHRYWAPLALRWMRGEPLPMIIDEAIKYHKKQGKKRSNSPVIREVLTDVETGLRFKYVNLLGCYVAVLKEALVASGHAEYVKKIPALTLYLELGAASQTMIQLMSLGLSRHTSNIVARLTINKDMDAASARAFLQRVNPDAAGLSTYLRNEISRVLSAAA